LAGIRFNHLARYIVRGIFFKLAFDFKLGKYNSVWMYGGEKRSDEFAIKASGHGNLTLPLLLLRYTPFAVNGRSNHEVVNMTIHRAQVVDHDASGVHTRLALPAHVHSRLSRLPSRLLLWYHPPPRTCARLISITASMMQYWR
jgi:hypothetical protein